jgi:hypothetical protein
MNIYQRRTFTSSYSTQQRSKFSATSSDISAVHSYMNFRQKRNKLLSFFPSINKNAPETHHLHTKSALYGNTAHDATVPAARVSTSTSVSLSSSSTVSSASAALEPRFHANHTSRIPEYTHLRKYLSRYNCHLHIHFVFNHICRFQNKLKLRAEILKLQLLPWFRKHTLSVCLCRERAQYTQDSPQSLGLFWGVKNSAKEKKELEFGRLILLRW